MTDSWDSSKPNLAKLPPHLREAIHQPIPLRPDEFYVRSHVFKNIHQKGLVHPKARLLCHAYREDANDLGPFSGIQLIVHEFRGREALHAFRVMNENSLHFVRCVVKAAIEAGADPEKIKEILNE